MTKSKTNFNFPSPCHLSFIIWCGAGELLFSTDVMLMAHTRRYTIGGLLLLPTLKNEKFKRTVVASGLEWMMKRNYSFSFLQILCSLHTISNFNTEKGDWNWTAWVSITKPHYLHARGRKYEKQSVRYMYPCGPLELKSTDHHPSIQQKARHTKW